MSRFDSIMQQYRTWPRAIQWAALGAIGMVLFLLWDNTLRPVADDLDKKIKMIESQVDRVRANETVARKLRDPQLKGLIKAYGPVRVPAHVADGSKMFNDVVLEVLQKHRSTNATFSTRPGSRLPKNALIEVTEGTSRIDRLTGEVKFDATPDAALAILTELETSPHIDAVNGIRLARDASGKVKVTLTVESWVRNVEKPTGTSI